MEFTGQLEFENSDLKEGMADYLEKTSLELLGDMGNIFSKFRRDLLTILEPRWVKVSQHSLDNLE